jgi:hypothetical protein
MKLLRSLVALSTLISATAFAGNLTVNLAPSAAVSAGAQWRVDGGTWKSSGTTIKNLSNATHAVDFKAVTGWVTPATASVTLVNGVTTTVTGTYLPPASLAITLSPTTGQWSVDGGAWRNSGTTASGLNPGAHSISYSALTGYTSPTTETATLTAGQTTNLTRSYTALSNLNVTLSPSTALWKVDNGAWQSSGTTLTSLASGTHSISYSAVAGYVAPPTESVTLLSGQTTNLARTYTALSNLTVTLSPSTASWQVDNGNWQSSGATATGLTPGAHAITYSGGGQMIAPPNETVTLISGQTTSLTRTYTPAGYVFVMLNPNTAQWRVDGGQWRATHTYSDLLVAGSHTVEYSPVTNMITPAPQTVTVTASQTLNVSKTYSAEATLIIELTPAVGQWRVDGGRWLNSYDWATPLAAGSHTVEYSAAPGYTAPPSETVNIAMGQTPILHRSYTAQSNLTVTFTPASGTWNVDNGPWQASGTTLTGLTPGAHSVSYNTLAGYTTPPSESVTLVAGQTTNLSRSYTALPNLTVTLTPSTASWRVDNGAWQPSGTTVTALAPGNHSISYEPVTGYTTPPDETVSLSSGSDKTLSRIYLLPASVSVNLSPTTGQWRVDGGSWQSSGSVVSNLALGAHQIEYAPLSGYLTPEAETVSLQAQTLNLARAYPQAPTSYLDVKTVPAYLTEIGVAKWRVDGGQWNTAGAPVSVPPGTHNLEFQPVAGLDVPAASSVTTSVGSVETVEATFYLTHRLRFFLHPDLVAGLSTQDLQARLTQYAAHLQTIWHRESLRRLIFAPATDITVTTANPFSNNAFPPVPEIGFELWIHADWSNGSVYGSNGGFIALDVSGAGGADGMHWTQIYDPSTLAPGSTDLYEYWKQIDTTTHEFEHVFGAGMGEYYSARNFDDATGVAPLYDVDYFAPADPFFAMHPDFWADPLLRNAWDNYRTGNATALPALLDAVHFSGTSRGIINGCYRNADSGFNGARTALPDLAHVRIRVVDSTTGQNIPGATLRIWNQPNPGPMSSQERTVVATSTPGVFEFNWTADSSFVPLNNWDNGKLLKAFANGYVAKAQWEWIYDAQRVKTLDNSDTWEITVALDPAP